LTEAERVFRDQVAAFNAGELEAFLATYSEDAVVKGAAPTEIAGRDAMRAHYAQRLAQPGLRCDVLACADVGDRWVVARERIVTADGERIVAAAFEVVDGHIVASTIV